MCIKQHRRLKSLLPILDATTTCGAALGVNGIRAVWNEFEPMFSDAKTSAVDDTGYFRLQIIHVFLTETLVARIEQIIDAIVEPFVDLILPC